MATYDNISVDEAIASAGQAQSTPPPVVQEVSTDPAQILFNSNGVEEKSVDELIADGNNKAKEVTGIDVTDATSLQEQIDNAFTNTKKGRPAKIKVDENTKSIISSLINDGTLKGFEDGKYETADDLKELITLNSQEKLESWQEEYAQNFYKQGGPI
jgi:superfamily II DNA or RNA helicase